MIIIIIMNKPVYKLKDWIDENKLPNYYLSLNPKAIDYLKNNPSKINWNSLCMNSNASNILLDIRNRNKLDWCCLSSNNNDDIVSFLLKPENINKINWSCFSMNNNDKAVEFLIKPENNNKINLYNFNENNNPKVVEFLIKPENQKYIIIDRFLAKKDAAPFILENIHTYINNKINMELICFNSNPILIDFFKANIDKLYWRYISRNPLLMDIVSDMNEEEYINKIDWFYLSLNTEKRAIDLLLRHPSKIDLEIIINNNSPYIIPYLLSNKNKIRWNILSTNPAIFELDYKKMKENFQNMEEEIIKEAYHPKRICKLIEAGIDIEELFS